ncbi:MAG: hypothetical protein HY544_00615 [Candidatus Diapherotrites archaeon]|uniref:Glycosidase n=1 Tax=Candidatus Iainarchaeum sp. TaxID=3101447 RepID=A0A8T3YIX1_9ARCH|nr:hypothetical protein [Candidatus Diapherotrites archaeon]
MKSRPKLLLSPEDIRPTLPNFRVRGVLNPGAVRLRDGKIMLYARIAETPKHGKRIFLAPRFSGTKRTKIIIEEIPRSKGRLGPESFIMDNSIYRLPTISHFRKILLDESGMNVVEASTAMDFAGLSEDGDFGVEDARITHLRKEKLYAMTYVSVSMCSGVSTSLALSRDLVEWERKGIIFRQQNKDAVIFPEKIGGMYAALHRPEGTMIFDKPRIWISYSNDLEFWGRDRPILSPRDNSWDELRIGPGAVPLLTGEGWLAIYHGVRYVNRKRPEKGKVYSAGAMLLDAKNPERVIARTPEDEPLFGPKEYYERTGFVNSVVFPTAAIPDRDGKGLLIYSGAADSCIEVRKIGIKEILGSLV